METPSRRFASTGSIVTIVSDDNALTTLIHRLEAATSRLEDIASSAQALDADNGSLANPTAASTKASSSEPNIRSVSQSNPPPTAAAEPLPESIKDMDALIEKEVKAFIDASKNIVPLVEEQSAAVAKGFADQRRFLLVSTKAKRPDPQSQTFMDLLKDLQQDLGTAGDIKDSNRGSPVKEHLAMVAEGISTLQWLVMDHKPADTVGEMIGGAQMYGNRILKTYKEGCVAASHSRSPRPLTPGTVTNHTSSLCEHTTPSSRRYRPMSRNITRPVSAGTQVAWTQHKRCEMSIMPRGRMEPLHLRHLHPHRRYQSLTTRHRLHQHRPEESRRPPQVEIWVPCLSN